MSFGARRTPTPMHNIDPSQYILYIVYPQLDSFASEGVQRSLSGFATIAQDADDYADKMFESYRGIGDDPSAFAEEARDQGIAHFTMLAESPAGHRESSCRITLPSV